MILYEYECEQCGKRFEALKRVDERWTHPCQCGGTGRLIPTNWRCRDWFRPHWNENFDLEPIYVRTKEHFKELCKDYGVYSKALGPIDDRRGA